MLRVTQNVQLCNGARGLIFGLRNHLFPYYASGSSEGSGETVQIAANAQAHYGLRCLLINVIHAKISTCCRLSEAVPMRPFFRAKMADVYRMHHTRGRNLRG